MPNNTKQLRIFLKMHGVEDVKEINSRTKNLLSQEVIPEVKVIHLKDGVKLECVTCLEHKIPDNN
jgi:hypothetical protein